MKLATEEMETDFNIMADDRNTLYVCSDDPVWMRKLDKLQSPCKVSEEGITHWYEFDLREFTFTLRPKQKMTEANRILASERMKKMRR